MPKIDLVSPLAAAAALAVCVHVAVTGAAVQEPAAMDPPGRTAPKPAADPQEPGKTATEAITNPAAAPPSEGAVGTSEPPKTGAATRVAPRR